MSKRKRIPAKVILVGEVVASSNIDRFASLRSKCIIHCYNKHTFDTEKVIEKVFR